MAGNEPIDDPIILTRDADFVHRYERDPADPPFPDGTTAEIVLTKTQDLTSPVLATWPAYDVTADHIDFWVQSEQTNAITERAARYRLMVVYPPTMGGAETQDWCWYRGPVKRSQ